MFSFPQSFGEIHKVNLESASLEATSRWQPKALSFIYSSPHEEVSALLMF
jgi:hypothetical protein